MTMKVSSQDVDDVGQTLMLSPAAGYQLRQAPDIAPPCASHSRLVALIINAEGYESELPS